MGAGDSDAGTGAFAEAKRLFFEGMAAVAAKDFATAEAKFRHSLALNPDRVSVLTNLAVNTIYNHWRFEDVWLDR